MDKAVRCKLIVRKPGVFIEVEFPGDLLFRQNAATAGKTPANPTYLVEITRWDRAGSQRSPSFPEINFPVISVAFAADRAR